ncbi:hypothetical protein BV881_28175 [Streptomyces sp. ZL-24]|uniref:hypothetical protein n=1 Tax=Streptomyces sp. ZL-24 TaxID=1933029 RepID=UPI000CD48415|nr:hypothetical protein [Streptomyces sp. ZL-24]POG44213.1 hypothetical protein BV881_28175 [Streptomyces sp. ZL-24]
MYTVQHMQVMNFNFPPTKNSTGTVTASIQVPAGANFVMAYLQGFNLSYTNHSAWWFGNLQVQVTANSTQQVQATVTLRDDNENSREWGGSVTACIVAYQGSNTAMEGNGQANEAGSALVSSTVSAGS